MLIWRLVMSLITCPDCANKVSDIATACPHCGRPMHIKLTKSPKIKFIFSIRTLIIMILIILVAAIAGYISIIVHRQSKVESQQMQEIHDSQKAVQYQQQIQTEEIKRRQKELEEQQRKQEEELLKSKAINAMEKLADKMLQAAFSAAKPVHSASNISRCRSTDKEIIRQDENGVEFSIDFECHMVGGLIGVNSYNVGIKVSGQVLRDGDDFSGTVLGAYVTYDVKQ